MINTFDRLTNHRRATEIARRKASGKPGVIASNDLAVSESGEITVQYNETISEQTSSNSDMYRMFEKIHSQLTIMNELLLIIADAQSQAMGTPLQLDRFNDMEIE